MLLSELIKKDKKELNKLSKVEIIESITGSKYQYKTLEAQVKELKENNTNASAEAVLCKKMIMGFLSMPLKKEGNYGEVDAWKDEPLIGLLGQLLAKTTN